MRRMIAPFGLGFLALVALSGCSYDYLQRTDKVSYRAGDAVRSNIEGAAEDPVDESRNRTNGLGKDGAITPVEDS